MVSSLPRLTIGSLADSWRVTARPKLPYTNITVTLYTKHLNTTSGCEAFKRLALHTKLLAISCNLKEKLLKYHPLYSLNKVFK
jgi:hypothetical protein